MKNSSQIRSLFFLCSFIALLAALSGCYAPSPSDEITTSPTITSSNMKSIQTIFICQVAEPLVKTTQGAPRATHGEGIPVADVALFQSEATIIRLFRGSLQSGSIVFGYEEMGRNYDIKPGDEYLVLQTENQLRDAYIDMDSVYLIRKGTLERIGQAGIEPDINGLKLDDALSILGINLEDTKK